METEELKPCPFCGSTPITVGEIIDGHTSEITNIVCVCGASFTLGRNLSKGTYEETVGSWNFRPIEDKLQKQIKELESIVSDYAEAHAFSACGEATAFVARIVHYFEQYGDKK